MKWTVVFHVNDIQKLDVLHDICKLKVFSLQIFYLTWYFLKVSKYRCSEFKGIIILTKRFKKYQM